MRKKTAKAIMFQGTGSDVGKSLMVAGFCRLLTRRGLKVLPFKPQNMSNNAAVTPDGGEIGRAQALQARAAGAALSVHMNPVLLKPQSETGSQIVVQGKVWGKAKAREYQALKPRLLPKVLESFAQLQEQADVILVEGAGSAAEINLRQGDIANMGFAVATQTPVVLVADIDRGGVIASLVGTKMLLSEDEQNLLKGYIINKFRGDTRLFADGFTVIEKHSGLKSFGLVPYFNGAADLPAEDVLALETLPQRPQANKKVTIAVPVLPHISNFDDFDPLVTDPNVSLTFIRPPDPIPVASDIIILPGSKSTIAALQALYQAGWHHDIYAHVRRGGFVLGICGGLQMLGTTIADPDGMEGDLTYSKALGLLPLATTLKGHKALCDVQAVHAQSGALVKGYEMHVGETTYTKAQRPFLLLEPGSRPEGFVSNDGLVMGTYLHGIFANDMFRQAFLQQVTGRPQEAYNYNTLVETRLDALALHLEENTDVEALLALTD